MLQIHTGLKLYHCLSTLAISADLGFLSNFVHASWSITRDQMESNGRWLKVWKSEAYWAMMQLSPVLGRLWGRTVSAWECLQVTWPFITPSSASTPPSPQTHTLSIQWHHRFLCFPNSQPHTSEVSWPTLVLGPPVKIECSAHSQPVKRWYRWMASASNCQVPADRCYNGSSSDASVALIHSWAPLGKNSNQIFCSLKTQDSEGQLYLFSQELLNLKRNGWKWQNWCPCLLMAPTKQGQDPGERVSKPCYEMDIGGRETVFRWSQKWDWWKVCWESAH